MIMQGRLVTGTPPKGPKGLQGGAVGVGLWDRPFASSPPRRAGRALLSQVSSSLSSFSSSFSSPFVPS